MNSYALTNPLIKQLNKDPADFTREDFLKLIVENNVDHITFHYTAIDGKLKELKLPVSTRKQVERILADGERVDGSSLFKGIVDSSLSDLYVVPVYKTAFLNPFQKGSLDFICRYLDREGNRAPFTLDNILHKASELFTRNTGLQLYAFGELEFYLLSDPKTNIFPAKKQNSYQASAPFVKTSEIVTEMMRYITRISGAVKYAHSEAGFINSVRSDLDEIRGKTAEQLEIEYLPTPIEETGDHLVLGRWIIRNVAYRHNCVATFAPKIEEGIAGNGLHIHSALMKDGKNIMVNEQGKLSENARRLIGGLCYYADTLTAFGNTVSAAYLRLVPNQEAPTRVSWSDSNRSAMIRVPLGWVEVSHLAAELNPQQKTGYQDSEGRQTVELRSPDGSAMVHLLLAGIALAAEWGLTHDESLEFARRFYTSGNIFKERKLLRNLPALPGSCAESAKRLLKKRELYQRDGVFPAGIIDYMANLLKSEHDQNINDHLIDLPADDRLHETRAIMHKDIHRH